MINKKLLKSKMVLNNITQIDIAQALGKDRTTISQKMNDNLIFKPEEISKIKEYLNLTDSEVIEIFISPNK